MATLPLASKLEQALEAYLLYALPAGLHIHTARAGGPAPGKPSLLIHLTGLDHHPDVPADAGTFQASIDVRLTADDPPGPLLDQHLHCTQVALSDLPAVQDRLNRPTTGADTRPIVALHLHDLWLTGSLPDPEGSDHHHILTYTAVVTNADQ